MSVTVPVRYPSGVSTHNKGEVFGDLGFPSPFTNHMVFDDFDWIGATGVKYTQTAPNSGTIAATAADGGKILFTTGAASGNPASIQSPVATFKMELGKRAFYVARFSMASVSVPVFTAGLIQTTTTPITVTDGIVFEKATASTAVTLKHYISSVASLSLSVPLTALTLTDAVEFDLGWYLDAKGYLFGFACPVVVNTSIGLFGNLAQNYSLIQRQAVCGGQVPSLTTVNLNPTLAITTQAAAAVTLTADFMGAAKERLA